MLRFLSGTRFLIIVPILGLALAAGVFFIFGGFQLISLIVTSRIEKVPDYSRRSGWIIKPQEQSYMGG